MKITKDVQHHIDCIRYYNQEIEKLVKKQFEIDIEQGNKSGINSEIGDTRFRILAAIPSACSWINSYCDNVIHNVKYAEEQDKKLGMTDEELEEIKMEEEKAVNQSVENSQESVNKNES